MDVVVIQPGATPACQCGSEEWTVHQRIERESNFIRVDGLGDIEVEPPNPLLYRQSLTLECNKCNKEYALDQQVEAWANGFEDCFNWPDRVSNGGDGLW